MTTPSPSPDDADGPAAAAASTPAALRVDGGQSADQPIIRLVDIHKAFGQLSVLEGASLDFYRGQATVILGPSGTGKSVLLKHIVGLLEPDRGEVWFENQRVDHRKELDRAEIRKQIGLLFQMGALFDSLTVADNICFPLVQHTSLSSTDRLSRCAEVLELVGLGGVERKMPAQLSGGQRKRVALARAIVLEPKVVLYDEPTTGLDPIRADVINELIVALGKNLGITSVVVTHDMASANKIADRMVMLYDGHVVADGDPQMFRQSKSELVQRFIQGRADQEDLDRIREAFARQRAESSVF